MVINKIYESIPYWKFYATFMTLKLRNTQTDFMYSSQIFDLN